MTHRLHLVLVPNDDLIAITGVEDDGVISLLVDLVAVVVVGEASHMALEAGVARNAAGAGVAVPRHLLHMAHIHHRFYDVALVGVCANRFPLCLLRGVAKVDGAPTPARVS
eukprot:CAMPEP_0181475462 /NCGR_PEP_ID=MMETSP1110-20121109/41199_1 /TAXON_ID=174948 /ORGANISM="Symbiodinium sp., Strain CCMP421" /LENGTH=110 /DNA_ID=CAMNT_0023600705 /DNA_START=145 /DNA_END=477 /DNA_ORIENTATION=+